MMNAHAATRMSTLRTIRCVHSNQDVMMHKSNFTVDVPFLRAMSSEQMGRSGESSRTLSAADTGQE